MATAETYRELFASTAPGLERVCEAELNALGIAGAAAAGGVGWRGDERSLYRANLELRTATRVLVRLGSFRARTFHELERRVARLAWSDYLPRGGAVVLRVTARKSKLYHEGAVAERVGRLLEGEHGARVDAGGRGDEESDVAGSQLFLVRLVRDVCTISADASGPLLHQRGYRQAVAKAPLRETIAAALLLVSGWRPGSPLVDPLCGSGTIAIEAALLARRIAPGLAAADGAVRRFAFENWPGFDRALWDEVVAAARAAILPSGARTIFGSDRNAGAIRAATANAARAGVADDVVLETRPLSAFAPPPAAGAVVTNPPYGVRVGERASLGPLYAELGRVLRERAHGWAVALLSADPRLDAAVGIALEERVRTRNGGIPVRMMVGTAASPGGTAVGPEEDGERNRMSLRIPALLLAIALAAGCSRQANPDTRVALADGAAAAGDTVVVWKSPTCGCCTAWVEHMRENGFTVVTHDTTDVEPIKRQLGVPAGRVSCHTATVRGYTIEGHVPADLVRKLIDEKSRFAGLAVPGMPMGSPGMESIVKQAYDVLAFDRNGNVEVYARR